MTGINQSMGYSKEIIGDLLGNVSASSSIKWASHYPISIPMPVNTEVGTTHSLTVST